MSTQPIFSPDFREPQVGIAPGNTRDFSACGFQWTRMKPSPVSEFPQRAAELPLSPACPGGFSFRTVFITGPSFQDEDALYFGSGLFPLPVSGFSHLIPTDPKKRHRVEDLDPVHFPWSSFPFRIFFPRRVSGPTENVAPDLEDVDVL